MKKPSLIIAVFPLLVFLINPGLAQNLQLAGMDFENWSQNYYNVMFPSNFYWENQPTSFWANSNAATTIVNDFCCERTSDCNSGSYAAHLETKSIFGVPAAGNLFTGTFVADGFNSQALRGVSFTDKPKSIKGYYKYTPANYDNGSATVPDTCAIYAILSYWDGAQRVEIARAEMYSANIASSYTLFDLDFIYYSNTTPDTVSVVFASSKYGDLFKGGIGSTLLIDDVEFVYPVGYAEDNTFSKVWNDGKNWIFSFRTNADRSIFLYDVSGRLIYKKSTSELNHQTTLDILNNGIFLYNIVEGEKTFSGKLVK